MWLTDLLLFICQKLFTKEWKKTGYRESAQLKENGSRMEELHSFICDPEANDLSAISASESCSVKQH